MRLVKIFIITLLSICSITLRATDEHVYTGIVDGETSVCIDNTYPYSIFPTALPADRDECPIFYDWRITGAESITYSTGNPNTSSTVNIKWSESASIKRIIVLVTNRIQADGGTGACSSGVEGGFDISDNLTINEGSCSGGGGGPGGPSDPGPYRLTEFTLTEYNNQSISYTETRSRFSSTPIPTLCADEYLASFVGETQNTGTDYLYKNIYLVNPADSFLINLNYRAIRQIGDDEPNGYVNIADYIQERSTLTFVCIGGDSLDTSIKFDLTSGFLRENVALVEVDFIPRIGLNLVSVSPPTCPIPGNDAEIVFESEASNIEYLKANLSSLERPEDGQCGTADGITVNGILLESDGNIDYDAQYTVCNQFTDDKSILIRKGADNLFSLNKDVLYTEVVNGELTDSIRTTIGPGLYSLLLEPSDNDGNPLNNGGCPVTYFFEIPDAPVVSITQDIAAANTSLNCFGDNTTLTAMAERQSGDELEYELLKKSGSIFSAVSGSLKSEDSGTEIQFSNVDAGVYKIRVRYKKNESTFCNWIESSEITISEPPQLGLTVNQRNLPDCIGGANGSLFLTPTGVDSDMTIKIYEGDYTSNMESIPPNYTLIESLDLYSSDDDDDDDGVEQTIPNLSAGNYVAVLERNSSCIKIVEADIVETRAYGVTMTPNAPDCKGGDDGNIVLSAFSGVSSGSFTITDLKINGNDEAVSEFYSTSTQTISGLKEGDSVTFKLKQGSCNKSTTVFEKTVPNVEDFIEIKTISKTQALCFDDKVGFTATVVNYGTGISQKKLHFSNNDEEVPLSTDYLGLVENAGKITATGLDFDKNYYLVVSDGICNDTSATISFINRDQPEFSSGQNTYQLTCYGDSTVVPISMQYAKGQLSKFDLILERKLPNESSFSNYNNFSYNINSTSSLTINNLPYGDYQLSGHDGDTCNFIPFTFSIVQPTYPFEIVEAQEDSLYGYKGLTYHVENYREANGSISVEAQGGETKYTFELYRNGNKLDSITRTVAANEVRTFTGLYASDGSGGIYNYTVKAIDSLTCDTTSTALTLREPELLELNFWLNKYSNSATDTFNIKCNGGTDTVFVRAKGGIPNYSVRLENLDNNSVVTQPLTDDGDTIYFAGLSAANYQLALTDKINTATTFSDTIKSAQFELIEPSAITSTTEMVKPTCFGGSDGSYTITPSGGVPYALGEYLIKFYDADTVELQTKLASSSTLVSDSGSYYYTVQDTLDGCSVIYHAFDIVEWPRLVIDTLVTEYPLCYGDSTAKLNVYIKNGRPLNDTYGVALYDSTHILVDSVTTDSNGYVLFESLFTGQYYLTTYDSALCSFQDSIYVGERNDQLAITQTVTEPSTCANSDNAKLRVYAFGGDGKHLFSIDNQNSWREADSLWTDENGYLQSTVLFDSLESGGIYEVLLKDTNYYAQSFDNSCLISKTDTISITPQLLLDVEKEDVSCYDATDGSLSIYPSYGDEKSLSFFDIKVLKNGDLFAENILELTDLAPANYKVEVRLSAKGACGVVARKEVSISRSPLPLYADVQSTTNYNCANPEEIVVRGNVEGGWPKNGYEYKFNNGTYESFVPNGGVFRFTESLTIGEHVLTIRDSKGCEESTTFTVEPLMLNVEVLKQTDVSCYGGNDGLLQLTSTNGNLAYKLWNATDSFKIAPTDTALFDAVPAGNFQLVARSGTCISDTLNFTFNSPDEITIDYTILNQPTCGEANGKVVINISGGVAPYTTNWLYKGGQLLAADALMAGDYIVIVEDAMGCQQRDSVYLEEQTDLSATVADISQASCGAANASVTLNITGGVPGYSIEWYNSQNALVGNGSLLSNISKGTYYYQLSDQSGCAITDTVLVGGDEALSVSIANATEATCGIANGSVDLSVTGGNAPYRVNWPTTIPVTNGLSASGLKGGIVYEVLVTDSTNCEQTFKFSIDNTNGPELGISQFNPSCGLENGTIEVTSITGKEPLSITWNGVADTSRLKTGLGEGTYSITVTDADSCSTTKVVELEEDLSNQLTVSNSITPSSCGGSNGVIELNIRGGFAPYQISWDDNASITEGRRTNLAAGTYEVTITDSVGCQIEKSIVLNEVASPLLTVESFVQASCGSANGSIVLSQLSNDYVYHWSHDDGITTNSAEGLSAGRYDIYSENGSCTTDTLSFYITSPGTDLNISVVETIAATCESTYDGAAEINISGGASPYTISWNDEQNQNVERASNLLPGTYTVLVTDASGCSAVKSVTVGTVNPVYIASFNKETPSCHTATDGSIEVVVAGGTGNYSYLWSTGASSKTLTDVAAGTYSVEVFDNDECAVSESVTLIAPDSLSLQASVAAPRCYESANGSAELSINGGTAPYSVSWPDGNTSLRRYDLPTGDYTVEVTDENGCLLTQVVTVPQKDSVTINYTIEHASCYNANDAGIELTSIGNARSPLVKWSNGQRGPILRNVTAGTYTATITDANGCATGFEFTITEPDLLQLVDVEVAATKCNDASNGSITYEVKGGTAPYTYRWSDGAISKNRSGLRAGIYEVLVTDNAGCVIAESFEIEEPDPLVITAELAGVSCFGSADGQATVEVNGGTAPYQISWPDGETTFTREDLTAGRYDVTITDANNCSLTQRITIDNINPIEIESISRDIPSCYQGSDGSISIEVAGGSGDYTISWENGAQGATIANIAAGTYAVTITDGNGCTFNGSIRLDDAAPINISQLIVADPICYDEPSGMVAVTPSGGSAPYKVIWEDGVEASERNDLLAGTHNFTIQDAEGCTTAYEVTLENPPLEELSNLPEIVYLCTGGYITLDAGNWDSYSWTSDNTFSSTEREVRIDAEGNYHIEVTNEAGCIDAHDIEVIKDDDLLQADFLLTSEAVVGDTVLIIDISWPMPGSVEWFNPDDKDFYLVSQEADYQEVIFTRTGEFEMSMKANLDQCEAYVTKTINVLSQDEAARLKEEELSKSQGKLHLSTNIYPNPNYGTFRLEVEGNQQHDIDVRIVDLHKGYEYYQLSGKQQQKHVFNITDDRLPAGVYIAVIETNGQTISKRFVVK